MVECGHAVILGDGWSNGCAGRISGQALVVLPIIVALSALSAVCSYKLRIWMHREPISENDLHWHIKSALTNKGYVVEFSGHQMRVWWRE